MLGTPSGSTGWHRISTVKLSSPVGSTGTKMVCISPPFIWNDVNLPWPKVRVIVRWALVVVV